MAVVLTDSFTNFSRILSSFYHCYEKRRARPPEASKKAKSMDAWIQAFPALTTHATVPLS
jgi:hypothetical protein